MNQTALAIPLDAEIIHSSQAVSLLPVEQMQAVLAEYDSRRLSFRTWLMSKLVRGVHYGVVPGTEPKQDSQGNYLSFDGKVVWPDQWRPEKPSLYKAGADFLCDLLMLDPSFSMDLDAWKMLGSKEGLVVVCCRLLSRGDSPFHPGRAKGEVVGEGRGAGQSGVKKRDGNGALKIAQKSAKVDAVINTLGISDLFTQDLEEQPAPPNPAPDQDPTAPKVGTRSERKQSADGIARPSGAELSGLKKQWQARANKPDGTIDEFVAWAGPVLKRDDFEALKQPKFWTLAEYDKCKEVML